LDVKIGKNNLTTK